MVSLPTPAISRVYGAFRRSEEPTEQAAMNRLAAARKFVFDPLAIGTEIFYGAAEYAQQLADIDRFRLPFDCVAFQIGPIAKPETARAFNLERLEVVCLAWHDGEAVCGRLYRLDAGTVASDGITFRGPPRWFGPDELFEPLAGVADKPAQVAKVGEAEFLRITERMGRLFWVMVFSAVGCLAARSGVSIEERPAPRFTNAKREAKGKPPLFSYSWVTIDPSLLRIPGVRLGGTHAPPRLHWRRGHVRTLSDGRRIPVAPCLVGDGARGFAEHDYIVKGAAA